MADGAVCRAVELNGKKCDELRQKLEPVLKRLEEIADFAKENTAQLRPAHQSPALKKLEDVASFAQVFHQKLLKQGQ